MVGPYAAFVYDKRLQRGIAFGNQTGDMSVFYYHDEKTNQLHLSNNYNVISEKVECPVLDEDAAHCLLTYGFFVDDITIIKQVKRVQAGKYLKIEDGKVLTDTYHRFDFITKQTMTMDEAIEETDRLFRQATRRCFDKDVEYAYPYHYAELSAGLDSRMTNWVAKDLGYKNIVNMNFAQSGSDEQRYALEVANALDNQFYFRTLDNCLHIYDVEEIVKLEFGTSYFSGNSVKDEIYNLADFDKIGLIHTGQIGDAVVSQSGSTNPNIDYEMGRNTSLLSLRLRPKEVFKCREEFFMYYRAFQNCLTTSYSASYFSYVVSPFMDIELMEFCFSVPEELRTNHRLYWQWIDKKYPKAGQLPTTRQKYEQDVTWQHRALLHRDGIKARYDNISRKIGYALGWGKSGWKKNHMNPYNYWYDTNQRVRNFIDNYYNDHIYLLDNYPILKSEADTMFNSTGFNKICAISLLAAIKIYLKK